MNAESPIHGSAMLMMNSGRLLSGNPCLGSWVNYGLGSENENLPGFVVMLDQTGGPISGAKNWSSGYMPATYQATVLRASGVPIHDLASPAGTERTTQRLLLDRLRQKNEAHLAARADNTELAARIASYELAFKMQQPRPRRSTSRQETAETACSLRHRSAAHGRFRPQVLDRPPTGRARRAVRPDLFRRRPQRRQLGRPRRSGRQPHQARRQHRQADRRPAQGSETQRAARSDAGGLGRRVRPPADRRVRQGDRPRPQCLRLHDVAGRRRDQGRGPASARPTSWATTPSKTASTSRTCTPRSCTSWASTPTD